MRVVPRGRNAHRRTTHGDRPLQTPLPRAGSNSSPAYRPEAATQKSAQPRHELRETAPSAAQDPVAPAVRNWRHDAAHRMKS